MMTNKRLAVTYWSTVTDDWKVESKQTCQVTDSPVPYGQVQNQPKQIRVLQDDITAQLVSLGSVELDHDVPYAASKVPRIS